MDMPIRGDHTLYLIVKRFTFLPGWFPFNRIYWKLTKKGGTWAEVEYLVNDAREKGILLYAHVEVE